MFFILGVLCSIYTAYAQGTPPPPTPTARFVYDAAGNRIQRYMDGFGVGKMIFDSVPIKDSALLNKFKEEKGINAKDKIVLDQKAASYGVSLFPNPARESLTIEVGKKQEGEKIELLLYDNAGKLMLKQTQEQVTGNINVGEIPNGIYNLHIRIGNREDLYYKILKVE